MVVVVVVLFVVVGRDRSCYSWVEIGVATRGSVLVVVVLAVVVVLFVG